MTDEEEQRLRPSSSDTGERKTRVDRLKLCLSASAWAFALSVALWLVFT